jgi:hypothetical protein
MAVHEKTIFEAVVRCVSATVNVEACKFITCNPRSKCTYKLWLWIAFLDILSGSRLPHCCIIDILVPAVYLFFVVRVPRGHCSSGFNDLSVAVSSVLEINIKDDRLS